MRTRLRSAGRSRRAAAGIAAALAVLFLCRGPAAGDNMRAPTISPRGSSAVDAFAELDRQGLHVVMHRMTMPMMVPAELRFRPVDGRRLVEAVAAAKGMKVAWMRGERGEIAFIYWGQPDADLEGFAREIASPDAAVRAEAVEKAALMRDVRAIPALLAAASSADENVARGIVNNLCRRPWAPILATESVRPAAWRLGERELAACGRGAFDSDLGRGGRLLEGMTAFGGPRALANVRKTLERTDPMARRMALEGLCRLIGRAALTEVEKGLKDEDPRVRGTAFEMLGRTEGAKALDRLDKALGDPEAAVRRGAVAGLGWIGGAESVSFIGKALADGDEGVRKAAVAALKRAGGDGAVALLEKALSDKQNHVAWPAARALGSAGGEKILPALAGRLSAGEVRERRLAMAALGEIGSPRAVELLEAAVADADAAVRGSAVSALAATGTDRAFDILLTRAAEEKDPAVRIAIAYGVTPCSTKFFAIEQKLWQDPDGAVRMAIPYAVRNFGCDDRVVTISVSGMKDPDPRVRQTSADSLGGAAGFDGYARARQALLDAVRTETDALALDEELVCLGSWRPQACAILVARLRSEKDPKTLRQIARGMRRMTIHDPEVARAFQDLNLPADQVYPGEARP